MAIEQLTAQGTPALNATRSTMHHFVSTANYKKTPATEIKRKKER